MKAKQLSRQRRVLTRYTAEDRERWIGEQARSGLTKKAFCERHGINLMTFHGWGKRNTSLTRRQTFAEVEVQDSATQAAVEVLLPNGARVGIRHQGKREDLVALVRGVAGC